MEHKLILGGEQYLPFARSRIKALRATGLVYASQQFEIDDASVKVQIAGEHEYIYIDGGACGFSMDSGVVELAPVFGPDKFKSGKLYSTSTTQGYESSFTQVSTKGLRNPGKTNLGQLAGAIKKGGRFVGLLPTGGVGSFAALRTPADPPTIPQTYPESESDGLLFSKKYLAAIAPPSIFTGKTRLYVQAMYGLPLYEYEANGFTLKKVNNLPNLNFDGGAPPALAISSFVHKDDFFTDNDGLQKLHSYPDVPISTSTGVYLDDGGRHWLFDLGGAVAVIYPLVSSRCGEKLRKYLTAGSKLNLEDRDHLEAFILAYSLPDAKYKQLCSSGPGDAGSSSMGYGWHWNWSGSTAVMTVNEPYSQDIGVSVEVARNFGMESTTYQIKMKQVPVEPPPGGFTKGSTRFVFEAARSILDGPTKWSVLRAAFCIVCPDWYGQLSKATPKFSQPVVSKAVFYSYYAKDELQLCTAQQFLRKGLTPARQMSPRFAAPEYGGSISSTTLGLLDGFCYDPVKEVDYLETEFRVGPYAVSNLLLGYGGTSQRLELKNKVMTPGDDYPIFGCGNPRFSSYDVGYPIGGLDALDPLTYPQTDAFTNVPCGGYNLLYTYTRTFEFKRIGKTSQLEIIIPANDSQAVFVNYLKTSYIDKTSTAQQCSGNAYANSWVYRSKIGEPGPPPSIIVDKYEYAGPFLTAQPAPVGGPTSEVIQDTNGVLIHGDKITPATFTLVAQFHDNALEAIGTTYSTVSNTDGKCVVSTHINSVGVGSLVPVAPAFVGWA